ncbi:MAG: hypothetical protein OXE49_14975 [Gemmatimonadetes bacterium]|nr:hypothetical protein [Gemmatimonadota bacterium]
MFNARLCNFADETLCNFSSLGDAASLRNQARDIGTRGEKAAFVQQLNTQSDC